MNLASEVFLFRVDVTTHFHFDARDKFFTSLYFFLFINWRNTPSDFFCQQIFVFIYCCDEILCGQQTQNDNVDEVL
jgi:hypothetical protein